MPAGKRQHFAESKRAALVLPITPLFLPSMVLLRRIFFIDTDKTRYVSVGFYPARNYDMLVEFGGPKLRPIVLADRYVHTVAKHSPTLCEKMCSDEQYRCVSGDFRLCTTRGYRTARLKLGDNYIVYRLQDVHYLLRIFYMVHMQHMRYLEAMPDVMNYATNALSAIDYVEPNVNANKYIVTHNSLTNSKHSGKRHAFPVL
jgi:hypothetical protein